MARCKSIEYTIPAADSAQDGKMNWMILSQYVGYQSQSRFSKAFFKYHKVLPMEYKRRNYSAML